MDPKKITENLESREVNIQGYKLNYLQLIVFVSAIVEIVACFLPMYTASVLGYSMSISYISGDGIFAILLAIATCACVYFKLRPVALGTAFIDLILILYACTLNLRNTTYGLVKLGFGGYLLMLSAVVLFIGALLAFMKGKQ